MPPLFVSLVFVPWLVLGFGAPCQTDRSGPLDFPKRILRKKHPHTSLSVCPTVMWDHCHDRIYFMSMYTLSKHSGEVSKALVEISRAMNKYQDDYSLKYGILNQQPPF